MAQPSKKPLFDYLNAAAPTERELRAILRDAADEAARLIPKLLEQNTTGGKIRAAQMAIVLREIRAQQSAMWGDIFPAVVKGVGNVMKAASQGEDVLFNYTNQSSTGLYKAAFAEQARRGLSHVLAKGANGIPLSTQVYRSQALATGQVHRLVQRGLLLQHDAKTIAKSVEHLIKPDTPGGVSYAAMRLARTEMNNAFKTAQEQRYKDEPWTKGMKWNLSGSHPEPDICNVLAEQNAHKLGAGVYPVGERPLSHPNCLCYLTPVQADEDEFIESFLAGDYNEYLDDTAYTYAPEGMLPCP